MVSDDDEFHVYPKPLQEMINDCEENGWEFITGGFIDRIGEDGTFPKVYNKTNIWKNFLMVDFLDIHFLGDLSK